MGVRDGTRDIKENSDSSEGHGVKKACLVIVSCYCVSTTTILGKEIRCFRRTDEDETAWEDVKEGIHIVGFCTIKPVEGHSCIATGDARENLNRSTGRATRAILTTHH